MLQPDITQKHLKFIKLVAKGMDLGKAYVAACDGTVTGSKARTYGSRLAKKYDKEILDAKKMVFTIQDKAWHDEAVREAVNSILTQTEVDKKLCAIITGEAVLEDFRLNIFTKTLEKIHRKPNIRETLSAIAEYNKRFGAYSPEKKEEIIKVVNLTPEQISEISKRLEDRY